jgi:Holliday junction resolvase
MSGALSGFKGDIVAGNLLIESKETGGESFYLKRTELRKIVGEANAAGKIPAMIVTFHLPSEGFPKEWLVVPLNEVLDERR